MAVGDAGPRSLSNPDSHPQTVVYFNLSPEGAVAVMKHLTRQLNEATTFTFMLYNPSDYGRYDSGVLYFERSNYEAVRQVLQTVYAENRSHFQSEVYQVACTRAGTSRRTKSKIYCPRKFR